VSAIDEASVAEPAPEVGLWPCGRGAFALAAELRAGYDHRRLRREIACALPEQHLEPTRCRGSDFAWQAVQTMPTSPTRTLPTVNPQFWGQAVRRAFFPLELEAASDRPFRADARFAARPALRVARIEASRHVAGVGRRQAQALDGRFVKVVWQLEGSACLHQHGRSLALAPDTWAVYDTSQPYALDEGDDASLVVLLCEAGAGAEWTRLCQAMAGRALPIDGPARIALGAVQAALCDGSPLTERSAGLLQFCTQSFLSCPPPPPPRLRSQRAAGRSAQRRVRRRTPPRPAATARS
jgi:hypothetical protein